MSQESSKPAGIRQIAGALGISIGTVDRALHGRSGVSPKTRDRVLKMATKLNYSPNVAARNLRLNRHLRVGVFLPTRLLRFTMYCEKEFDRLQSHGRAPGLNWPSTPILDWVTVIWKL